MANWEHWKAAVNRHGGTEGISIPFSPSVRFLQDQDFCGTLQLDLSKWATNWEKRKATKNLWTTLPDLPGLYMFVWKNTEIGFPTDTNSQEFFSWCLYVGQAGANNSSNTLKSRYQQEYSSYINSDPDNFWVETANHTRKSRLKLLLSLSPIEFWYTMVEDRSKIENLESRLIRAFRPPGNSLGKNTLKPRQPVAAFRSI